MKGKIDILLGSQFGDEGKGKIVDVITKEYDIVCRFQGGNNAGHTIKFENKSYVLHLIPSGIFDPYSINVIGNGVVIDPIELVKEIESLESDEVDVKSRLIISEKAHLILPLHKLADKQMEESKGESKIGSTLKGIGPAYTHKVSRNGVRVGDIFSESFENDLQYIFSDLNIMNENLDFIEACKKLRNYTILDTTYYLNQALSEGKSILAEGAQGALLDIDFGTYPFVTSSNTTVGGAVTGLGIPATKVNKVIGIFKAYTTRVGSGPFPTELDNEIGKTIRKNGSEFGATTGRARRCGWLDLPLLKYSCMINGITELYMMKADVLSGFEEIKIATHYLINGSITTQIPYNLSEIDSIEYKSFKGLGNEDLSDCESLVDLPTECLDYINFIEDYLKIPISIISVGPDREQTIFKD